MQFINRQFYLSVIRSIPGNLLKDTLAFLPLVYLPQYRQQLKAHFSQQFFLQAERSSFCISTKTNILRKEG